MDGDYFDVFNNCFNIHIRISEERLEPGSRDSSICFIIAAIDVLLSVANFCRMSKNSGSIDILVWCPDKDTDIFRILNLARH
jgi:hypothetical protein